MKDQWAEHRFQRETPQQTAVVNAAALSQIEVLDKLLELDSEQIREAFESE